MEKRVVCSLFKDLFVDMSKRNLHKNKQFLLQRFFDFTSQKTDGRSVTNPYKLKGHMLHLPPIPPENGEGSSSETSKVVVAGPSEISKSVPGSSETGEEVKEVVQGSGCGQG